MIKNWYNPGNALNNTVEYQIAEGSTPVLAIYFQNGPVAENGENGVQVEDVLEVALTRLQELNELFPCRENSLAITNIEQGLLWLKRRTELRTQQGVEGYNLPHSS